MRSGFLLKVRDDGSSHRSEVGALRENRGSTVFLLGLGVQVTDQVWSMDVDLGFCSRPKMMMCLGLVHRISAFRTLTRLALKPCCNHTFFFEDLTFRSFRSV